MKGITEVLLREWKPRLARALKIVLKKERAAAAIDANWW